MTFMPRETEVLHATLTVYLRPESLTERVEEVLLLCGLFDLASGDLNLRYQAYESRTA
jgi:hypothetical protein